MVFIYTGQKEYVPACFDKSPSDMLQLLPGLHKEIVALGDFYRDLLARVTRPDV